MVRAIVAEEPDWRIRPEGKEFLCGLCVRKSAPDDAIGKMPMPRISRYSLGFGRRISIVAPLP